MVIALEKMATCELYAHIYAGMPLDAGVSSKETQDSMRERLNNALRELYEAIRDFLQEAQSHFPPSGEFQ